MDWGSVADWVAALGTSGSLGAALVLIRSDRRAKLVEELDRIEVGVRLRGDLAEGEDDEWELRIANGSAHSLQDFEAHVYFLACSPYEDGDEWVGMTYAVAHFSRGAAFIWPVPEVTDGLRPHDDNFVVVRCRHRGRTWLLRDGQVPVQLSVWNRRRLLHELESCHATARSAQTYRRLDWRLRRRVPGTSGAESALEP